MTKVHKEDNDCYAIWCPGCEEVHVLQGWTFNGDFDKPTFTPSLKISSVGIRTHVLCHSHITDGKIIFLNDSIHPLAGQTVDLPEFKWSSDE